MRLLPILIIAFAFFCVVYSDENCSSAEADCCEGTNYNCYCSDSCFNGVDKIQPCTGNICTGCRTYLKGCGVAVISILSIAGCACCCFCCAGIAYLINRSNKRRRAFYNSRPLNVPYQQPVYSTTVVQMPPNTNYGAIPADTPPPQYYYPPATSQMSQQPGSDPLEQRGEYYHQSASSPVIPGYEPTTQVYGQGYQQ